MIKGAVNGANNTDFVEKQGLQNTHGHGIVCETASVLGCNS